MSRCVLALVYQPASMALDGRAWAKTWLFASSFQQMASLGGRCPHCWNAHPAERGKDQLDFASRKAATYPPALASAFASLISLLDVKGLDLSRSACVPLTPIKNLDAPSWSKNDGAGRNSYGDWSILRTFSARCVSNFSTSAPNGRDQPESWQELSFRHLSHLSHCSPQMRWQKLGRLCLCSLVWGCKNLI